MGPAKVRVMEVPVLRSGVRAVGGVIEHQVAVLGLPLGTSNFGRLVQTDFRISRDSGQVLLLAFLSIVVITYYSFVVETHIT